MAINIVQVKSNIDLPGNASNNTINADQNFTAGNKVFFIVSSWEGANASVTIGGVTAVIDKTQDAGSQDVATIWRADNVGGGRSDVVLGSGLPSYSCAAIIEVSGLASGGPETSGAATGFSNTPNVTASSAATTADSLVLGCYSNSSDGTHPSAANTGYTLAYNVGTEGGGGAYKIVSSTATHNITFTYTGNSINWGAIIASYPAISDTGINFFGLKFN